MRLPHLVQLAAAAAAPVLLAAVLSACGSDPSTAPAATTKGSTLTTPSGCEQGDPACMCVDVDASQYDHACQVDSVCVAITSGTLCGGAAASCLVANDAVNKDSYSAFDKDRQPVESSSCVPTTPGTVACVSNACVILPAGCASASDGGDGGDAGDGGRPSGCYASATGGGDDTTGGGGITTGDDDGTGDLPIPILGDDDDDDNPPVVTGDDDGSGSSTGDDDDDDDAKSKRHLHAQSARHADGGTVQSPPVTDLLK